MHEYICRAMQRLHEDDLAGHVLMQADWEARLGQLRLAQFDIKEEDWHHNLEAQPSVTMESTTKATAATRRFLGSSLS